MPTTSITLLERMTIDEGDHEAWARFAELYTPLLLAWCRRTGVRSDQCDDVVQEILTKLMEKLGLYKHQTGKFRNWLHTVARNVAVDHLRQENRRPEKPLDSDATETIGIAECDLLEEEEYNRYLYRRAIELMKGEFKQRDWQACVEATISGDSAQTIADRHGMTLNMVYIAKARVLRRVRQELEGPLAE